MKTMKMKAMAAAVVAFVGLGAGAGFPDGARVAFYGDSITRNGEAVVRSVARLRTASPDCGVRAFLVGVSGGGVNAAHLYFDGWLAPLKPTHVVLGFGVNDAGATAFRKDAESREAELARIDCAEKKFEREYGRLIDRIEAIGAKAILRTPTPYDEFSSGPAADGATRAAANAGRNAAHGRIADAVRRVAARRGLPLVDDFALFAMRMDAGEDLFRGDRIHPDERGQFALAEDFLAAQGLVAGQFRPFGAVAAETGLAEWYKAATRLSDVLSAEWMLVRDETLGFEARLAKVRRWLAEKEGKANANVYVVGLAKRYLADKPREMELRTAEEEAWEGSTK